MEDKKKYKTKSTIFFAPRMLLSTKWIKFIPIVDNRIRITFRAYVDNMYVTAFIVVKDGCDLKRFQGMYALNHVFFNIIGFIDKRNRERIAIKINRFDWKNISYEDWRSQNTKFKWTKRSVCEEAEKISTYYTSLEEGKEK